MTSCLQNWNYFHNEWYRVPSVLWQCWPGPLGVRSRSQTEEMAPKFLRAFKIRPLLKIRLKSINYILTTESHRTISYCNPIKFKTLAKWKTNYYINSRVQKKPKSVCMCVHLCMHIGNFAAVSLWLFHTNIKHYQSSMAHCRTSTNRSDMGQLQL